MSAGIKKIEFGNIAVKLGAIKNKDTAGIVSKQVYIPFAGVLDTNKLENWLDVRSKVLEDAQKRSEPEIKEEIEKLIGKLCEDCKLLADVNNNESIKEPCGEKDYEILCKIRLYQFSLGLR